MVYPGFEGVCAGQERGCGQSKFREPRLFKDTPTFPEYDGYKINNRNPVLP